MIVENTYLERSKKIDRLVKYFSELLDLSGWQIQCGYSRGPEFLEHGCSAVIHYKTGTKRAILEVRHPHDWPGGMDGEWSQNLPESIAHELVHLHIGAVTESAVSPSQRASSGYNHAAYIIEEQAVVSIARALATQYEQLKEGKRKKRDVKK